MSADRVALAGGVVAPALILGALGFQYVAGIPPCEMCHWQRWPHINAAILGILGGGLIAARRLDRKYAGPLALLTLALVAASGAIAAYQAGVRWGFFPGRAACTGST